MYRDDRGREFATHGLSRRLNMLEHCMDRIFETVPPEEGEPSRSALMDATAFVQTFVINVYGAIDNLAHVWCSESDLRDKQGRPLAPMRIGLGPKCQFVRASLPADLQTYLGELDAWFAYLEGYRHALAHRVPLYIPPRQLGPTAQEEYAAIEVERLEAVKRKDWHRVGELGAAQDRLGSFVGFIMHSFSEGAQPMRFHAQLICDLATVVELGERVFGALDAAPDRKAS
nr:hypothetical protein [Novosphingobium panipatense]